MLVESEVIRTKIIANLKEFISEKFKPIPKSIINPIIHCNENAPINLSLIHI